MNQHQCHKDDCDSEATHGVRMTITCRDPGIAEVVKMNCSIRVCEKHADEKLIREYVLSDQNRETILTQLTEFGHRQPDFLSAAFSFYPLAAPEDEKITAIHVRQAAVRCDRLDCLQPAKWQIIWNIRMMWQPKTAPPVMEVLTNFCVCERHHAETTKADLLADGGEEATRDWLAGRGVNMVNFEASDIGFVPLFNGRVNPVEFVGENQPTDAIDR